MMESLMASKSSQNISVSDMQKNYVTQETKVVYTPAEAGNWGYGFGAWVMDDSLTHL